MTDYRSVRRAAEQRAAQWETAALTYVDPMREPQFLVCQALALHERRAAMLCELLDALNANDARREAKLVEAGFSCAAARAMLSLP